MFNGVCRTCVRSDEDVRKWYGRHDKLLRRAQPKHLRHAQQFIASVRNKPPKTPGYMGYVQQLAWALKEVGRTESGRARTAQLMGGHVVRFDKDCPAERRFTLPRKPCLSTWTKRMGLPATLCGQTTASRKRSASLKKRQKGPKRNKHPWALG